MATNDVKIIISAIDKASQVFKNLGKTISNTAKKSASSMDATSVAGTGLRGSLSKLTTGAIASVVAIGAIAVAAKVATRAITRLAVEGSRFDLLKEAFNTMTVGVVENTSEFIQAMKNASAQTLTSTTIMTNANRALALIGRESFGDFQTDFAKMVEFSTKASLAMGQSVEYMFDSLVRGVGRASPLILDNLGIQVRAKETNERYAASIGKTAEELTFQEQKIATLNEAMEQLSRKYGNISLDADRLALSSQALATSLVELKTIVGQALAPGLEVLVSILGRGLVSATGVAQGGLKTLSLAFLALTTGIAGAITGIISFVRILRGVFSSILSFSFDPLVDAIASSYGDFAAIVQTSSQKMEDIQNRSIDRQGDEFRQGMQEMEEAHGEKTSKLAKDLEKETRKFKEEMAKRAKNFKESLTDMIFAHIDKRDSIIEDIDDENAAYAQRVADRVRDFDEAMEEMEERHEEKVERIKDQIEDELEKQEEADEKRLKSLEKLLRREEQRLNRLERDEQVRLNAKLARLRKNYDMEVALGEGNEEELYGILQDRIEEEKSISADRVDAIAGYRKEELARIRAEEEKELEKKREDEAERLSELRDNLTEEITNHEEALAKKEEIFARETQRAKEEHDKRISNFKEALAKEEEILDKHRSDVEAVKDQMREDDITRLKRKFAEENAEAEKQHQQKLKDMAESGASEGAAYGAAMGDAMDTLKTDLIQTSKEMAKEFAENIKEGAIEAGKNLISGWLQGLVERFVSLPDAVRDLVAGNFPGLAELGKNLGIFSRHTGGVIPGPIGTDVPILAKAGEKISPIGLGGASDRESGGGDVNINVSVGIYAGAETEKRNLARELYAALLQVAQSQNKTVAQLMGG